MKYSIAFLFFIVAFTSCESKKENTTSESSKSPKKTVAAYLTATNQFDFKKAKEFLIPNKGNLMNLETLKKMEKSIPDDKKSEFLDILKNVEYFEKEITDSTAQIIVTPKKEIATPIEFDLKKVNEKWLIESVILH